MVGEAFDRKEESMETRKFCTVNVDLIRRSRDMGDVAAKVLVWKATVFKQPGNSGKIWGGSTHIQSITDDMCHAKPESISRA